MAKVFAKSDKFCGPYSSTVLAQQVHFLFEK